MAKKQRIDQELFDKLRKSGLRKSVAKQLSTAGKAANDRAPAALRKTLADLGDVLSDLETRVTGPSSRSQAAKKGAATRARSTRSGSRSTGSRSTSSRSTGTRSTGSRSKTGTGRRRPSATRSRSR